MVDGQGLESVFDRRERVMISGVLQLAERPVRKVMTVRTDIDFIDLADSPEEIHQALSNSPHSRLLVIRNRQIDEPLGYVHKKEIFKALLAGDQPNLESLVRTTINLPESCSVLNALELMRGESTHTGFVVDEFGGLTGMVTMTDILESIAGELPDASEIDGPDVTALDGGYLVSGALNLNLLRERVGLQVRPTDDYQTLAGFVVSLLDRLPSKGDQLTFEGWRLTVDEVQERRVTRVFLQPAEASLA